jgi:hypothetical protein
LFVLGYVALTTRHLLPATVGSLSTCGDCSVGIVRLRAKRHGVRLFDYFCVSLRYRLQLPDVGGPSDVCSGSLCTVVAKEGHIRVGDLLETEEPRDKMGQYLGYCVEHHLQLLE